METNIKDIEDDIEYLHLLDRSSEIVLYNIYNSLPYTDTLVSHFHKSSDLTNI